MASPRNDDTMDDIMMNMIHDGGAPVEGDDLHQQADDGSQYLLDYEYEEEQIPQEKMWYIIHQYLAHQPKCEYIFIFCI